MTATMPGYAHFVWMFFMQPVTLHDRLEACGVYQPSIGALDWLLQPLHANYRAYLLRLLVVLLLPVAGFLFFAVIASVFHLTLPLGKMARGVAVAVAGSVVCSVVLGMAFSVAFGAAFGVMFGLVFGVVSGVESRLEFGMALAVAVGLAIGVGSSVERGIVGDVEKGVMLGVAVGVGALMGFGIPGGWAVTLCFLGFLLQLHLYALEVLLQFLLQSFNQNNPNRSLAFSPVLFHERIYFPLPRLTDHIVAAANHDAALALRVIQATQYSPGCGLLPTAPWPSSPPKSLSRYSMPKILPPSTPWKVFGYMAQKRPTPCYALWPSPPALCRQQKTVLPLTSLCNT